MQNYEPNQIENFPSPPIKKDVLPPDLLPVSPNNPPWNSGIALLVWIASVAFIVIVPSSLALPYILSQSVDFTDRTKLLEMSQSDPTVLLISVLGVIPAHLLTLALAWLVITNFRKFSFSETLGWNWDGFKFWHCLVILSGFYILAGTAAYYFPEQENDMLRILRSSRMAVYVVAFLATFTAPIVEEVIYRGVLYSAFQRTLGAPVGVLLVTILFALVHVPQYYPSYSTIFLICLLSLVLTLVRVYTKNLLPCIALHMVFNGLQSLLLILEPYLPTNITNTPEPTASIFHFFK